MNAPIAVDRFETVGLDELAESAALMMRVDRKYVVRSDLAARVVAGFEENTRVLEVGGIRSSAYESVYFDTPDLLSFHLAAQPRRRRFKLRTRTYVEARTAFLELKTRGARSATVKERIAYAPEASARLTGDAVDYAAGGLDAIGIDAHRAEELTARLTTRYRRATLIAADALARCTIDTSLEWREVGGAVMATPRLVIIETKSPNGRCAFDRALWRSGVRPVSISKYATGLAALHPELPRNRWARVLRTAFAESLGSDDISVTHTKETACSPAA